MNISLKLHLLFVIIIIALMFYMHFMNKNMTVFETELNLLKAKVNALLPPDIQSIDKQVKKILDIPDSIREESESDNDSVSTTEIKDIIDTIEDECENVEEETCNVEEETCNVEESDKYNEESEEENNEDIKENIISDSNVDVNIDTKNHPFLKMSFNDLSQQKYDDLKLFLKNIGLSTRGTKLEMAKKITEINSGN